MRLYPFFASPPFLQTERPGRFILLLGIMGISLVSSMEVVKLPPEAKREKARLEFLFAEIPQRYPAVIRKQVNNMELRMYRVTWFQKRLQVSGTHRIAIPADIIRVWSYFKTIEFRGENLNRPGNKIVLCAPGKKRSTFWGWGDARKLTGQAGKLHIIAGRDSGYSIEFSGKMSVFEISLSSPAGVSSVFDESIWGTLGAEQPVREVRIRLHPQRIRALAGIARVPRERY
ncbi:MAG: hypothetical protein D6820_08800, partial [Lentisphaerae bacterium]